MGTLPVTYPRYVGGLPSILVAQEKTYETVSLPVPILDVMDEYLDGNAWGLKSRPELIKAAVREFMMRYPKPGPGKRMDDLPDPREADRI